MCVTHKMVFGDVVAFLRKELLCNAQKDSSTTLRMIRRGGMEKNMTITDTGMTELQMWADLRTMLTGFYEATICFDERGLEIKFDNGQIFTITIKEKK